MQGKRSLTLALVSFTFVVAGIFGVNSWRWSHFVAVLPSAGGLATLENDNNSKTLDDRITVLCSTAPPVASKAEASDVGPPGPPPVGLGVPRRIAVAVNPCISQWQQSGTTKQLRNALESYVMALDAGLPWVPGPLADDHTTHCTIPFETVLNMSALKRKFPGSVLSGVNPSSLNAAAFHPVMMCKRENCFLGTERHKRAWKEVLASLDVVDRLKAVVEAVKPRDPYVCLHARIEKDYEVFFRNSLRYKNTQDIIRMMTSYRFPDGIRTLYVAGGTPDAVRAAVEQQASLPFQRVVSKTNAAEQLLLLTQLDKSLIDLMVCQEAAVFVGTAGSIWSEWVHGNRKVRNLPSLMYAGDKPVHQLEPFVGANDRRFFDIGYDGPLEIVDAWVGNYGLEVRDARIVLAVESARHGSSISIPGDFHRFFGYDPMPEAVKKCNVTVRVRGPKGEGPIYSFEAPENVGAVWHAP